MKLLIILSLAALVAAFLFIVQPAFWAIISLGAKIQGY